MNNMQLANEKYIKYRMIFLVSALVVATLEALLLIHSLTFTSDALFRLEIETSFLVLLTVVYFAVLLVFEVIIMLMGKKYTIGGVLLSVFYSSIHYFAFRGRWIDVFTRSDYAIIPRLLLKLLIIFVMIQLIWSLFITVKLFKKNRREGL